MRVGEVRSVHPLVYSGAWMHARADKKPSRWRLGGGEVSEETRRPVMGFQCCGGKWVNGGSVCYRLRMIKWYLKILVKYLCVHAHTERERKKNTHADASYARTHPHKKTNKQTNI